MRLSSAKISERIEVLLGLEILGGPMNILFERVSTPTARAGIEDSRHPLPYYFDSVSDPQSECLRSCKNVPNCVDYNFIKNSRMFQILSPFERVRNLLQKIITLSAAHFQYVTAIKSVRVGQSYSQRRYR